MVYIYNPKNSAIDVSMDICLLMGENAILLNTTKTHQNICDNS